jgi:hypothetical protein
MIDTLQDHEIGWNYKEHNKESKFFFSGIPCQVIESNSKIPEHEVLGYIEINQFSSNDGSYVAKIEAQMQKIEAVAVTCLDGVVIIPKESIWRRGIQRIEGYWYSESEPRYAMPIPHQLNEIDAQEIYELIKLKEVDAQQMLYRGFSSSCIDNTTFESLDYSHKKWIWPEGFAEHYVLKYRVKPSKDFLTFIGWLK